MLQELDVNNGKDLELIKIFYWQQHAAVRVGQDMSDYFDITVTAFRKVNNIRYADDTAIVAYSEEQLQNLIDVRESSHKVFAIWGWMIFGWAIENSAMTFCCYEK